MQPVLKLLAALLLVASPAWADTTVGKTVDQMDPAPNPLPGGTAIYCSILGLDCNLVEAPPGNLARLLGFYTTASGNVIMGNFTDSAGVAVEQPMPPCADTGTNGLVYDVTKTPRLGCGTSTLPAPTAGAITWSVNLNPTGTSSTTFTMAGLAQAITPTAYGRVLVQFNGTMTNTNVGGTGAGGNYRICWGTGSAPANGAAVPGGATCIGAAIQVTASTTLVQSASGVGWITGLTLGTPIWIDLEQATASVGTATITGLNFLANEQ